MAENNVEFPPVSEKSFATDFRILKVSEKFKVLTKNKSLVATREVLGSRPAFDQVDLSFDFQDYDADLRKKANREKSNLARDYDKLEKKMQANLSNGRPQEFGLSDEKILISSSKYKVLFRQKVPATVPIQGPRPPDNQ